MCCSFSCLRPRGDGRDDFQGTFSLFLFLSHRSFFWLIASAGLGFCMVLFTDIIASYIIFAFLYATCAFCTSLSSAMLGRALRFEENRCHVSLTSSSPASASAIRAKESWLTNHSLDSSRYYSKTRFSLFFTFALFLSLCLQTGIQVGLDQFPIESMFLLLSSVLAMCALYAFLLFFRILRLDNRARSLQHSLSFSHSSNLLESLPLSANVSL